MSAYRSSHSPQPPQLILGFGNTTHHAIRAGIAVLADILNEPADAEQPHARYTRDG
jgi:hypothetical protein